MLVRDGGEEDPRGAGAEALDPQTGKLLATVPLGTTPSSIAVGAGAVWVLDADDTTISAIDPERRSLESVFSTSSTPTDLAAGAGALWIGNAFRELPFSATSYPESVSRLDPETRVVVATIRLPRPSVVRYNVASRFSWLLEHIAVTSDAVWVVGADLGVYRIDPRTNQRVGGRVQGVDAVGIAAGGGGVWVIEFGEARVAKIDPRTNTITQRIRVPSEGLSSIAVGTRDVWAADPFGGLVWRIDPGLKLPRRIPLDVGVNWVAVGAGAVWATNELAGLVYRIDPSTNEAHVVRRTDGPATVAVGGGAAWVSVAGPPPAGTALPSLGLQQDSLRRRGQPALPDRLRFSVEGLGKSLPPTRWWRRSGSFSSGVATGPARTRSATSPATTRPPRAEGSTTFAATGTRRRTRGTPT